MSRHPLSKAFSIRSRVANASPVPDVLYLDANAILDVALSRKYGQDVDNYLEHVVSNNGMITWSALTIYEVRNIIHVNEYTKFADAQGIQPDGNRKAWKMAEDSASKPDARRISEFVLGLTDQIFEKLENNYGLPLEAGNDRAHTHLADRLYLTCGGGFPDALHVAIANVAGINSLLTQDAHFLTYPYVNVFGASQEIHTQRSPDNALVPHVDYFSLAEGDEGKVKTQ